MSIGGTKTDFSATRVALVHDELVRRGGAEQVFEELLRVFPQANVYALYSSNTPHLTVNGTRYPIRTTFLQRLPLWFRRHPRRLVALLPHAAERIDLSKYDLVISSSSAFAKGIITRSTISHICYCHTPTRYLWERRERGIFKITGQHLLRLADFAAAQRPDIYIANSEYTKQRIWRYYRRSSHVVYPPINTAFYTPGVSNGFLPPHKGGAGGFFLCVGRLTPSKNFDQAIGVCEKLRIPLRIVGVGSDYKRLKHLAGQYTEFLGKVSDSELRDQYRGAHALLQPGIEDFGIASAEALACGTPVIAVGQGGIQEIVTSSKLGILYREPVAEHLAEAIRQFLNRADPFKPAELQQHVLKFSRAQFTAGIKNIIEKALATRHT